MLALTLASHSALVPNSRPAVPSRRVALGGVSRLALGVGAAALAATPLAALADEEVPMSKAKAKIAAAKAAAEAKVAERGYSVPEAQEAQAITFAPKSGVKLSKEGKLLAEASGGGQKCLARSSPARLVTAPWAHPLAPRCPCRHPRRAPPRGRRSEALRWCRRPRCRPMMSPLLARPG